MGGSSLGGHKPLGSRIGLSLSRKLHLRFLKKTAPIPVRVESWIDAEARCCIFAMAGIQLSAGSGIHPIVGSFFLRIKSLGHRRGHFPVFEQKWVYLNGFHNDPKATRRLGFRYPHSKIFWEGI